MDDEKKTIQIGVKWLMSQEAVNNWGIIMAGTLVALAPTVIMFLSLQKTFVRSLIRSGSKG